MVRADWLLVQGVRARQVIGGGLRGRGGVHHHLGGEGGGEVEGGGINRQEKGYYQARRGEEGDMVRRVKQGRRDMARRVKQGVGVGGN